MLPRFLKQGILGEAKRDDCAELDTTAPEVLADLAMREDAASLLQRRQRDTKSMTPRKALSMTT